MVPGLDPHPFGEPRRRSAAALWLPLLLALGVPVGAGLWLHNRLVAQREAVDAAWAQVESGYRRRADLIPALVESVQRHMRHESETHERVVSVRNRGIERFAAAARELEGAQQASSRALQALDGAAPVTPESLAGLAASQAEIDRGIGQLLAIAESYPELRSADHFLELQAQLEGTENRIHVARTAFNEAVREYNAALEQIPTRLIAEARGDVRRAYFQTDEASRHASSLGFD
jgi:LemA protein